MARKLRLEYAGACYHVIVGTTEGFVRGKGAAETFERCLFEAPSQRGETIVVMREQGLVEGWQPMNSGTTAEWRIRRWYQRAASKRRVR